MIPPISPRSPEFEDLGFYHKINDCWGDPLQFDESDVEPNPESDFFFEPNSSPLFSESSQMSCHQSPKRPDPLFFEKSLTEKGVSSSSLSLSPPLSSDVSGKWTLEEYLPERIRINGCEIKRAYKDNGSVHPKDLEQTSSSYLACLDGMGIPKNLSMSLFGMTATILYTYKWDANDPHFTTDPRMAPIPHLPLLEHYRLYRDQLVEKDLEILLKLLSWMYSYHWTPYCLGNSGEKLEGICRFRKSYFKIYSNHNPVCAYPFEGEFYLENRELLEMYDLGYEIQKEGTSYCINIQKMPTHSIKEIEVFRSDLIIPGHRDRRFMFYRAPYTPSLVHPDDITIEGYFDFEKSIPFRGWRRAEYLKLKNLWDIWSNSTNIDLVIGQLTEIIYKLASHAKIFWSKEHYAKDGRGVQESYRRIFLGSNLYPLIDEIEKKLNLSYEFLHLPEFAPPASSSSSSSSIIFEKTPIGTNISISSTSASRSSAARWTLEECSANIIRINGCEIKRPPLQNDGLIHPAYFDQTTQAYLACLDQMEIPRTFSLPIFGTTASIIDLKGPDFHDQNKSHWITSSLPMPLLEYYRQNCDSLTEEDTQVLLKLLSWIYSYHHCTSNFGKKLHKTIEFNYRQIKCEFKINSSGEFINGYLFEGSFFLKNVSLLQIYGLDCNIIREREAYRVVIERTSILHRPLVTIKRPEFLDPEYPESGNISFTCDYCIDLPSKLTLERYVDFRFKRIFLEWRARVYENLKKLYLNYESDPQKYTPSSASKAELQNAVYSLASHARGYWNDDYLEMVQNTRTQKQVAKSCRELFLGVGLYPLIRKIEKNLGLKYTFNNTQESIPPEDFSLNSEAAALLNSPADPEWSNISLEASEPMAIDVEREESVLSLPPSIPSEAREDNAKEIREVGSLLQQLNKLISKYYGSIIPDKLHKLLIDQKGKWGIDLSRSEISENDFLKPFYRFLISHGAFKNRKAAIKAVQEAFRFFGFISSSMPVDGEDHIDLYCSSVTPCDEDLARLCIKELLAQTEASVYLHSPLCDFSAREIQQTLLSLKLAEFSIIAKNYHHFYTRKSTLPAALPCFLLTQDANYVRIQVLEAYFNDRQLLEGVGEEGEDRLASTFLEEYLDEAPTIQHSSQGKSTRLTWEQFQQFQQSFNASSSNSSLPKALVIERLVPIAPMEETSEEIRKELSSVRQLTERHAPTNKRKREDFSNLLSSSEKRKKTHEKEEETTHIRGTESRKPLRFENEFNPINDEDEIISPSRLAAANPSTGELPIIPSAPGMSPELKVPEIHLDNFWEALNARSLVQISAKVSREKIKETVLSELKPLEYPILGSLQSVAASVRFYPFGRLLKRYQIHTVAQLLQSSLAGISKLLSLPPGFGKTFVIGEYIVQSIATEPSHQIHVIAGPDALLYQNQRELSRYTAEASVTAWQLTGKKGASKGQYIRLFEKSIDFYECSLDDLSRFLRVIAYFPHAAKESLNGYRALISNQLVAAKALELLRKHIEYTRELYQNDSKNLKWFNTQIQSLCTYFDIPFNSLKELDGFIERKLRDEKDDVLRFKLYRLVGYALDLDPDRPILSSYQDVYSDASLERVRNLGIAEKTPWIIRSKSSKDLANLDLDSKRPLDHPLILITTPEGLGQQTNYLKHFPIGSLVVDEASRIHTSQSVVSEYVKKAIQELKLHSSDERQKNSILFVTGTPFENNLAELWNLLTMSSGEFMFSKEAFDALVNVLLKGCVQYLTNPENLNAASQANDPTILVKAFAHFMHFRNIVKQLVHHLAQDDPQALKDWKGRFPTVEYRDIPYILSEDLIQEINATRGSKLFSANKRIERILIHPSLKESKMAVQQSQNWPFLEPLRNGNLSEKGQWIGQSVYLTAILTNRFFIGAIRNKEKIIIVANHLGLCKAYTEAIHILFSKDRVFTRIFDGQLDQGEKAKVIEEYKNASRDNPAVLLLMIKSGGVGLNLAEADRLFLTGTSWNLATDFQAICRIARANNIGTKYVHRLSFPGTYYSTHSQLIQDIKKKWESFLWKKTSCLKDSFDLWCDVLEAETYRAYLNQAQDLIDADSKNESVREFLRSWAQNISLQELTNFFDRTKPTVPLISPISEPRPQSSSSSTSTPILPRPVSASAPQLSAPAPKLPMPRPLPTPSRPVSASAPQLSAPVLKLPMPLPLPTPSLPVSASTPQSSSSSASIPARKLPLPLPLPTKSQQPSAPRF